MTAGAAEHGPLERVARRVLDALPDLAVPAWVRIELAGVGVMIVVTPATATALGTGSALTECPPSPRHAPTES